MKNTDQTVHIHQLSQQVAKRLRQLREHLELSRPKFASLLGLPPTTLKNYELGAREIGGGILLLIANNQELMRYTNWLLTGRGSINECEESI
ncbi:helix-turn-helix transcriptional regulator [Aeromonas hydrophila]|uniref:helix-turn-helix domain-containing protein n=1 Tax=Aeromonas hydrophila TaxID=644 RepID=UPI001C04B380|nr:helix-turn-helix transcriptional regulator [Aeromonas hydrophila]QWL80262.1 helix-turn-helix transcriptional regulator [Aeromonas hydrophila]